MVESDEIVMDETALCIGMLCPLLVFMGWVLFMSSYVKPSRMDGYGPLYGLLMVLSMFGTTAAVLFIRKRFFLDRMRKQA